MACIVYQTNAKTGIKYAYRSESYRDPVTKKPTSRRTYLGRVDPITNVIIGKAEKGKRNRTKLVTEEQRTREADEAAKRIEDLEEQIRNLQTKLNKMQTHCNEADNILKQIAKASSSLPRIEIE